MVLVFLCMLVTTTDGFAIPYLMGKFTDFMATGQYGYVPYILGSWLIIWLIIHLSIFLEAFFFGKVRKKINIELKDRVFKRSFSPGYERKKESDFIATITSEIKQLETKIVNTSVRFVYAILQAVITFIFLLIINWEVGLVFVVLGLLPTMVPRLTSKWLQRGTEDWEQANQKYIEELEDGLRARNLLKRYQAVRFFFNQIFTSLTKEEERYFTMNIRQKASTYFVTSLMIVTSIISLSYGSVIVIKGDLTIGMLLTIYMTADRVVTPLTSIVAAYNEMVGTDPLLIKVLQDETRTEKIKKPIFSTLDDYLISLQNVSIGYDKNNPISKQITFDVQKKDRILIEGPSGSGKSTLIKTIMNEQNALDGKIIYGSSLKGSVSDAFAMVEQQPFVFRNTIRYNLTLGREKSEQELCYALEKVGLSRFATKKGLGIQLGSDAHQLSGGELKRFEVARAILFDKDILVVDEALSGLDEKHADKLNQLIVSFPGTVINIEHRLDERFRKRYNKIIKLTDF